LLVLALLLATEAHAKTRADCDRVYQPQFGQPGKDINWEPTVDPIVDLMLKMAQTTSRDLVIDLGAGDGAIVIGAAKRFHTRAIGIEYNPDLAKLAQCYVEVEGLTDKAQVIRGDIFHYDFSKATVLTLYLEYELNVRLRPTILDMRPGTRVVSHRHSMGDWQPDQKSDYQNDPVFFWIVPAKAQGQWTLKEPGGDTLRLSLTQTYQELTGSVEVGGKKYSNLTGSLRGEAITVSFNDERNTEHHWTGTVKSGRMRLSEARGRPYEGTRT
jgi:hypothetical protein